MQKSIKMADNFIKLVDFSSLSSREKKTYWNRDSCIMSAFKHEHLTWKRLLHLSVFERKLYECQKEINYYTLM